MALSDEARAPIGLSVYEINISSSKSALTSNYSRINNIKYSLSSYKRKKPLRHNSKRKNPLILGWHILLRLSMYSDMELVEEIEELL